MNRGRVALLIACVVVAGLGTWFALSGWDGASRVVNVAAAVVTVVAIGVAVSTAWRAPAKPGTDDGDGGGTA